VSFVHRAEAGAGERWPASPGGESRPIQVLRTVIKWCALAGGAVLVLLVLITAFSATSNVFLGKPFTGEYELAKHFVAIAIFTFLPYCQLTGANVTVDIFTEGMSERAKSAMLAFSSLFALAFALLLLWRMSLGFRDYVRYPEMTPTLHLPLWTAFPPILVSLALLAAASLITLYEGWRGMRGLAAPPHDPIVPQ
jgi:TRAP-type C4-dicarboxylate transport system permease small subunit